MTDELRISTVAFAARNLTSAIDSGFVDKIAFAEICRETENGNLIKFLTEKLGDFDWSLFGSNIDHQGSLFVEAMQFEAEILKDRERRKLGIRNSGVCLLLAFCIEAMQQLGKDKNYYQKYKKA